MDSVVVGVFVDELSNVADVAKDLVATGRARVRRDWRDMIIEGEVSSSWFEL